jgi:hypothetical protein
LLFVACDRTEPREPPVLAAKPTVAKPIAAKPAATNTAELAPVGRPHRFPAPARLVAIGDIHGDLDAARRALRLAGAIDEKDRWIGGDLVVVQTGDQLDRGDDERAIMHLFERLGAEAKKQGGAVHALNGNHETMNVAGDFRYVTPGGFRDFASVNETGANASQVAQVPPHAQGRARAFFPGGPYAKKLAERNTIVIVGDSVFVHGGVLPAHVSQGIGNINQEISTWMSGNATAVPGSLRNEDAPVWSRHYSSDNTSAADCKMLNAVLESLKAKRMVVGHTPQKHGVTSACDDQIWRVDVGLAAHYGGNASRTQVLEIQGDKVRVLRTVPAR